jgi:hypothetical protein
MEDSLMTTAPAPDPEAARNHVFHCQQYMDNALEALQKNEPGKAGELLWGSVTQAVDAWRGPVIDDQRSLMNFAYSLETEIGDPSFRFVLRSASSLHHNFYVPVDTVEEIERLLPGMQAATTDILGLLPDEARNGSGRE